MGYKVVLKFTDREDIESIELGTLKEAEATGKQGKQLYNASDYEIVTT